MGVPIGGATILTRGTRPSAAGKSNPDGSFLLEGLAPGQVELRVTADGRVQIDRTTCVVLPGASIEGLRIVLHRGARITGRVVGPDGVGRKGADVVLELEDESIPSAARRPRDERLTTNVQGRFAFRGLVPGTYRLTATDGKVRRMPVTPEGSTRTGIPLAEGESIDNVELLLPAAGRVTGLVTGPDGNGVVAAYVFVRGEDWDVNESEWPPYTDVDGRFTIDGLPPGEVTITAVSRLLVSSIEARTVVSAGQASDVKIALVSGTRLRFTTATSSMPFPMEFVASDERGRQRRLYSGGAWQSENFNEPSYGPLPPGRYDIVATAMNDKRWRGKADLRGEESVTVTMQPDP